MKAFLLISILMISNLGLADKYAPFLVTLSAWDDNTCAIDLYGVKCWGINSIDVPQLNRPTQVSAGESHTCAIDLYGVKCWGWNGSGQTNVPPLNHPTQVSAGGDHTCALDADGVKCWGDNGSGQTNVPPLNHPTQVSAGGDHTCALDADGVKCWGWNGSGQTNVPQLNHTTQVSAGDTHTCAIDLDGVKCWGRHKFGQIDVPQLNHPTQVSAGGTHTCALDADGVKCWGGNYYGQTNVPELNYPTQVTVGEEHTCAVDLFGVKCWGRNKFGQIDVPKDYVGGISVFPHMARVYFEVHRKCINSVNKILEDNRVIDSDKGLTYFSLNLLKPLSRSPDTSYIRGQFLPKYNYYLNQLRVYLGYSDDGRGFYTTLDTELTRKLAITLIESAISTSLEFISAGDQKNLQDALRVTGQSLAEPMNNSKIQSLLQKLNGLKSEKQKLRRFAKSGFLADSIELAASWLQEKVK